MLIDKRYRRAAEVVPAIRFHGMTADAVQIWIDASRPKTGRNWSRDASVSEVAPGAPAGSVVISTRDGARFTLSPGQWLVRDWDDHLHAVTDAAFGMRFREESST